MEYSDPDPIGEAVGAGTNRILQVASSVVTAAQVQVYLSRQFVARRQGSDGELLALAAQQRAERAAARTGLTSIRDPGWLEDADLNRAIQAWAAVMPYGDPSLPWHHHHARTVMRQAEHRLRQLHPHAMTRYDNLISEGADPGFAMLQAAPLFGYPAAASSPPAPPPTTLSTLTASHPVQARTGARTLVAAPPWEQDFPLPIDEVLAAAAGKDSAVPPSSESAPQVPRESRTGPQP